MCNLSNLMLYTKEEIKKIYKVGDKGLKQLIVRGAIDLYHVSDRIIRYQVVEDKMQDNVYQYQFEITYDKSTVSDNKMHIDVPYLRKYKTKKKGVVYYFGVNKTVADKVYAATGYLLRNKNFTDFREAEKYAWDMYETYIKQTLKSYSKQNITKGSLKYIWKEFQKTRFVEKNATALERTLSSRTQKDYQKCYKMLSNLKVNSDTKFIDINLTRITQLQATQIYTALYREVKGRWSKMCMDFVRAIFNFGKRNGFLTGDNPFAALRIPQNTKEQKLWEPEDIEKFCKTAEEMGKPEYALAVKLNIFLSLRPADFLKLRTSDIEETEDGWHYFKTISNKTKIKSFGCFPAELYKQINKNKDKIIDVKLETFESNFRKIVIKAGIDGCTFKNIRNTAITNYFDAGASVGEVMSISGHKKPDTTLRIYRQNTIQQSRNAYSKLLEKQNNILQISYG